MYRIVDTPLKLELARVSWLSGPNARGSGSTTASDGTEQTFTGIGDVVSFQFDFTPKLRTAARRERGFILSLLSGANACRVSFDGGDALSPEEAGVDAITSQAWSNGEPWSNGKRWKSKDYPTVAVAAVAAIDTDTVQLDDSYWGHMLGVGDAIGFFPSHYGHYTIIEVIDEDLGQYRIWPRLRKALAVTDFATLDPVMIMKTMPGGFSLARGAMTTEGQMVVLTEIIDSYAQQYFTG